MAYIKQEWNSYNEALTIEQNVQRHAVVTPQFLEHIEDGIVELDRKSFGKVNVTVAKDIEASGEVIDGTLNLIIPEPEGEKGEAGLDGFDGKSAYELAVDNGYTGTEIEWLTSLKGEQGNPGEAGANGNDGADGKSAYELAVDNGYTGTETEWLASLKGDKGDTGENGASIGVATTDPVIDAGTNTGTIAKESVSPVLNVGEHFISLSGSIYSIDEVTDDNYVISSTNINLAQSAEGTSGADGFSIGVAVVEPIDGEISVQQVNSVTKVGDHFIAPSGEIFRITEVREDSYMSETTGVTIKGAGAGVDFKGEAIGHCSNLAVTVVNDNTENPQLQVTYTDPISEGIPYGGTVVAIKENELPATPEDADFTKDTMDKDAHKTEPVVFDIPRSDTLQRTFFATLFPYSSNGVYNLLKKERKEFIMNWVEEQIVYQHQTFSNIGKVYAPQETQAFSAKYVSSTIELFGLTKKYMNDLVITDNTTGTTYTLTAAQATQMITDAYPDYAKPQLQDGEYAPYTDLGLFSYDCMSDGIITKDNKIYFASNTSYAYKNGSEISTSGGASFIDFINVWAFDTVSKEFSFVKMVDIEALNEKNISRLIIVDGHIFAYKGDGSCAYLFDNFEISSDASPVVMDLGTDGFNIFTLKTYNSTSTYGTFISFDGQTLIKTFGSKYVYSYNESTNTITVNTIIDDNSAKNVSGGTRYKINNPSNENEVFVITKSSNTLELMIYDKDANVLDNSAKKYPYTIWKQTISVGFISEITVDNGKIIIYHCTSSGSKQYRIDSIELSRVID